MPYTTEVIHQIWNDKTGELIYVGPDSDSFELIEIKTIDAYSKTISSVIVTKEEALLIAKSLMILASPISNSEQE